MSKTDRPAPDDRPASKQIDAIIEMHTDWRGKMLSDLRSVVTSTDSKIFEEVKWKKPSKPEGVPVWSCDGIICVADTLKNSVRLTFPKGAAIDDPEGVFNTRLDSRTVRAVDFHDGTVINRNALSSIIREAMHLNLEKSSKHK